MTTPGERPADQTAADDSMRDPHASRVTILTVIEEEVVISTEGYIESKAAKTHVPITLGVILTDRVRATLAVLVFSTFLLTFVVQPFRIPSESMEHTLLVGDFLLVNKAVFGDPSGAQNSSGTWNWLLPQRHPQRGDVVVFRFPLDANDHVVKRVIGIPGDRLFLRNGVVYRNGQPLYEPYTVQPAISSAYNPQRVSGPPGAGQAGRRYREQGSFDSFRDDFPSSRFTDPGVDAHWWFELQRNLVHGELVVPPGRYFVMGDNRTFSRDSRYWGFVPSANIVGSPVLIYFSVREASRTDPDPLLDDRLGISTVGRWLNFARWERTLRVVH